MSVFGFIENFFFISLALVFVLVLFLVYHFKNRISVAEKKSESMYGLLTAVVKEIKTLRGMFGLAVSTEKDEPVNVPVTNFEIKTKSVPEVNVVDVEPPNNRFAEREVITLDFAASEAKTDNKIVVSDVDSDDSEDSESESSEESDSGDESNTEHREYEELELEDIIDVTSPILNIAILDDHNLVEEDLSAVVDESTAAVDESTAVVDESTAVVDESTAVVDESTAVVDESTAAVDESTAVVDESTAVNDESTVVETVSYVSESIIFNQRPSIDQLRKMNINQLKTIAIQHGISADTSKMKKPELISLINDL